MKRRIEKNFLMLLIFLSLFMLTSCVKLILPQETEPTTQTEVPQTSLETGTTDQLPLQPDTPQTGEHIHLFFLSETKEASCSAEGRMIYTCSCGEQREETTERKSHEFSSPTCTEPGKCVVCGAAGEAALGHSFSPCIRCGYDSAHPIRLFGTSCNFNETQDTIRQRLGNPDEIIREGIFTAFLYHLSSQSFTILQFDDVGLWGVYTMDPSALFRSSGETISLRSVTGTIDPETEAIEKSYSDFLCTAFRDSIKNENFAIWIHLADCPYDYMHDSNITSDFTGQELLSFYITNAIRAKNGLRGLSYSSVASGVSREYCSYMIQNDFFGHDDLYDERLTSAGIRWSFCGENLSIGYQNVFYVMNAYYNSSGHRENLLKAEFTHLGTGFVIAANLTVYGAQEYYSLR